MRTLAILVVTMAVTAPLTAQGLDSALIRRALRLHAQVPMIDGHNDLPWEIRTRFRSSVDSARLEGNPGLHTDIPRLRAGRVGGQFWSIYLTTALAQQLGPRGVLEQVDIVRRLEERYPDVFVPALTADDIVRAHRQGRIASLIGVEGGDYMQSSLPVLRQFYALGARYMTLTWNATLPWADAHTTPDSLSHHGLTPFGREVVREMNRLGMIVDISHVSDSVMAQVLRLSEAPVMFSHSSARGVAHHTRNVPDWILRELPRNGGVVMVNFYCNFVDSAAIRYAAEARAALQSLRGAHGADSASLRSALAAWRTQHPAPPRPDLGVVANHIEHVRRVAGVHHVGYGSDYDGIDCAPRGLEDVSTFPSLTAELLRRGWSEADVRQVIGLNVLRVMRGVEATAARVQRERRPSEATLAGLDSLGVRR